MKILMVITTLDTGGAEKHLHLLTEGLIRKGFQVDLAYLKGGGSLAPDFQRLGVRVEKIPFESLLMLPVAVFKLAARIRRGAYDLVHSHLLKADLISALASLFCKPRVLIASKHNDERALLNPLFSFVHGLVSKRTQRIIVLSDHVGRFIEEKGRIPPGKIKRIYYGLNPESFSQKHPSKGELRKELGLDEGACVLIMVARFAPQKDHASLLRACQALKEEKKKFHLLLVGDDPFGDNRTKMETLCASLGLEGVVTFTGVRNDVPHLLGLSQIFVMPTNWEGLGLVFLEAMAYSLPIVSTKVSAVPEIVAHKTTGLLVPPNDPMALKEALDQLIANPQMAKSFGEAGKKRLISMFSLTRMIDETEKTYLKSLE